MHITLNQQTQPVPPGWEDEPLLWLLREPLGLTGTRFGCGVGQCGACTVLIDGVAQRACLQTARGLQGRSITTVEGLAAADGTLHPVQQAWLDLRVPQCGYCQSGQIMGAVALLRAAPVMRRSTPPWRATCAAAAPSTACVRPFTRLPGVRSHEAPPVLDGSGRRGTHRDARRLQPGAGDPQAPHLHRR